MTIAHFLILIFLVAFSCSAVGQPIPRVTVPAGSFNMGQNDWSSTSYYRDEYPLHSVYVEEFDISVYEITNQQYADFLNAVGQEEDAGGHRYYDFGDPQARITRGGGTYSVVSGYEDHPVTEVSWYGANAYCRWQGGRLPTEAEYEKAAAWDTSHSRMWPWGDFWDCSRNSSWVCNYPDSTRPVGSFPTGASYFGCLDIAGNVWEWTMGGYSNYPGNVYLPSWSDPTRNVQRGGSWTNSDYNLRCATRSPQPNYITDANLGFRVVWSVTEPQVIPPATPNVTERQVWTEHFSTPISMTQTKEWWGSGAEWFVDTGSGYLVARQYRDGGSYPAGEYMAMFRRYIGPRFSVGDVVDVTVRLRYDRGDRDYARTSVAFSWGSGTGIEPGGRGADENTGYPWYLLANNSDLNNVWHEVTCYRTVVEDTTICLGFGLWCNSSDLASPPIVTDHKMYVDWIRVEHSPAEVGVVGYQVY